MCELETVLSALKSIRAPRTTSEYDLHALVDEALMAGGLTHQHEVSLAPRRRIDFLCGTIGIEIKKGRPQLTPLLRQLTAYAQSDTLTALILVAEHPPRLPATISGKPLSILSLQRLWGVAI